MNRKHENLIRGFGDGMESSRPLRWDDPLGPRVYSRPLNIRQIVSFWGRVKAAWLVFRMDAFAVRWYDDKNAHRYQQSWYEWVRSKDTARLDASGLLHDPR